MSTSTSPRADGPEGHPEARVYHLLGRLVLEPPDEELLAEVATWASRWQEVSEDEPLRDALEPIAAAGDASATRLNESFTRLFRGVTPDAPTPPYESLYRDEVFQGPSARAVRSAYQSAGVDVAPDSGELADHLGIELHFVGTLMARDEVQAAESFLEDHPRQWVGAFADAVRERDPHPFYRGVLEVIELVLDVQSQKR